MTKVDKLFRKRVITKDSITLGKVSGAVMDNSWKITYLHVALNKQATYKLGYKKPIMDHVTLCLPVHILEKKSKTIHLDKALEEFKVFLEC